MTKFDAIIIGSGQAGNPLAHKLAEAGWKVALVEKRWLGGTCINDGCTPTKTMIASARVARQVTRSAEFGIHTTGFSVNMEEVFQRKSSVVLSFRESLMQGMIRTPNIELFFGVAAFTGPKEVTVTKADGSRDTLTADKIFINAGTRPHIPSIPGLGEGDYLTSTSVMELREVPRHLLIIGGSYIALEFAQLFHRLGAEVTLVDTAEHFLPKEDADIADELKKILEEEGITMHINSKVTQFAASRPAPGTIRLDISKGQGTIVLEGSHLLIATGREADTGSLHVAAAGIQLNNRGFIAVNDKLETNIAGIYALGDIKGGPQFTHISYNDYLVVAGNLLNNSNTGIADRLLNYVLFTDPELGRVGLTEKEARDKGIAIKVATLPLTSVARGIETGETRGLLKAIVQTDNKKIIGAAVLASGGGELMSILQMAMMGGITYDRIRDAIFAHPTFAESLNNLFAKLDENDAKSAKG